MKILKFGLPFMALLTAASGTAAGDSRVEKAMACGLSWDQADKILSSLKRMDEAPPKLDGLAQMARPDLQSFDEWQAIGSRDGAIYFKDYDAGSNGVFGMKTKAVIMERGSPLTRTNPDRILRIVLDADFAKARKAVLAGLGRDACEDEVSVDGVQGCLLGKPAASPADLDQLAVSVSPDGMVTYECLYIDAEAQKRLDTLRDTMK